MYGTDHFRKSPSWLLLIYDAIKEHGEITGHDKQITEDALNGWQGLQWIVTKELYQAQVLFCLWTQ